jgi:23S rRNA (uracil1939-C5)-methyltransferase
MSKKPLPLLEKVLITDIGAEGNALARVNDFVVFVPMLIPGDVADIRVVKKRKNYLEGRAVRFHSYSPDRIKPVCAHFGVCGGCKWQHLPYGLQLYHKEKQVRDTLTRIGKVNINGAEPVIGSADQFFYRNKLEFTFSDKRWLTQEEMKSDKDFSKEDAIGFHIPGMFDKVLDITECHLQPEPSNAIRNFVRNYSHKNRLTFFNAKNQTGFLRNLVVRNSSDGKVMVIVVFFYDDEKRRSDLLCDLSKAFPEITSLMYAVNSKRNDSLGDQEIILYRGDDHLTEVMEGLRFRVGPKSFYQTNTKQAVVLYNIAKEFAGLTGRETVYDLYTGTGTIACFVAGSAGKVIGIESLEEAVEDALLNAEMNGITNTRFFAGDIRKILNGQFFSLNGSPDVVITDPPRAGMHEDVVRAILDASPARIVYISCNPATQARDISLISERYTISRIQPVDMFPHTHHIENLILMEKINL